MTDRTEELNEKYKNRKLLEELAWYANYPPKGYIRKADTDLIQWVMIQTYHKLKEDKSTTIVKTGECFKLGECPFCGSTKQNIYRMIDKNGMTAGVFLTCMGCSITFYQEEACTVEEMVDAWNRRSIDEV